MGRQDTGCIRNIFIIVPMNISGLYVPKIADALEKLGNYNPLLTLLSVTAQ